MSILPEPSPLPPLSAVTVPDDDDNDTASQRSISLSSPAGSARSSMVGMTDINIGPEPGDDNPALQRLMAMIPQTEQDSKDSKVLSTDLDNKRASQPYTLDTDFSSEADDASSLYTHNDRVDNESPNTSAAPSVFEDKEPSVFTTTSPNLNDLSTRSSTTSSFSYPPGPPDMREHGFGHANRSDDRESIASFASTSSRKARPESMIILPNVGPLILGIALVDFNHLVGPRIEYSRGTIFEDEEVAKILPFLALPDGAHLSVEDYSYFHIVPPGPRPTTLFGISCNQQLPASELLVKGPDVTRSTVQKAVVVLASKPLFGPIRDKLGVITTALFQQRDFRETTILDDFESSLEPAVRSQLTESGLYMGTSLRELVHTFRQKTLILVKALMLQKRIMFYGHPVERLCTYQYSLVSLLPGLLQTLDDSGSPPLASRAPTLSRPTSLRTSDHKSMMAYMGLPLDIFGKDAFFQPYLPLQQLDMLKETKSWLCGTTNSIVTQQKEIDILINTETGLFEFRDPKLERIVGLTAADRQWMEEIVRDVNEGWSDHDPTRPASMKFKGSDDYLRAKFEEYVSASLSSVKYRDFTTKGEKGGVIIPGTSGSDATSAEDFNPLWMNEFKKTNAYEVWERITDPLLFDIVEPRHPCGSKPSVVSDIGLRLQEGIQELKLDQQLAPAREAVSRTVAAGSAGFFKAVEGVRVRWQRSNSSSSSLVSDRQSRSSTPIEISKSDLDGLGADLPASQAQPPSPKPLLLARSSTVDPNLSSSAPTPTQTAAATVSSWGAGIGSFLSSRKFSIPKVTQQPSVPAIKEERTPTHASNSSFNGMFSFPLGRKEPALPPDPPLDSVSPLPIAKSPTETVYPSLKTPTAASNGIVPVQPPVEHKQSSDS